MSTCEYWKRLCKLKQNIYWNSILETAPDSCTNVWISDNI